MFLKVKKKAELKPNYYADQCDTGKQSRTS